MTETTEIDFTFAAVRGPRQLFYFPEFLFLPPFCFVVTALCAFEDCRVTLGDTKDSLQGVSVVSDVMGRVRVSVCGVCVRVSVCGVCVRCLCACVCVRCLNVSNDVAVKTITR